MKILLVSTLYNPYEIGGAERSTRLIAKGYKNQGYEVEVLTSCNRDYYAFVDDIKVNYVKLKHIFWRYNSKKQSFIKKILWRLVEPINILNTSKLTKKIIEINPDFIHTNNFAGIGYKIWDIAKSLDIKIIHTARDYYLLCAKSGMYRNKKACKSQCNMCSIYTSIYKNKSHKVDAFVGVSDFVKNIHLKNGYFKNIRISSSINNIYNAKINKNVSSRKRLAFGIIGYIRETKGVVQLLENLIFKDFDILIAGSISSGNYSKKFYNIVTKNKNIKYLGQVNSSKFYNKIDYLIHPAVWHEPFPRVLIESFSYGIPVLASSNGGTKEAIIGKSTGYVFNDYNHLNKIISEILENKIDRNNLSKNCIEYAKNTFTEKRIIENYIKLLDVIQ